MEQTEQLQNYFAFNPLIDVSRVLDNGGHAMTARFVLINMVELGVSHILTGKI
jgi:hypothetical protein